MLRSLRFRAGSTKGNEVYPIGFRERLPVIGIPLRSTDKDVALDLQPLIDICHERGRYHGLDYKVPLDPPLNAEDRAWTDQILRANGLI